MQQQNKKTPLIFRVSLVLLCALVISTRLMGGLYARYSTTATGSDSARVAKFSFSDNYETQMQTVSLSISPGEDAALPIKITNTGEVALRYTVTVKNLTKNLPIADQTSDSGTLASGASTDTFNIIIKWDKNEKSPEYIGKMDLLQITVSVEQVN